MYAEYDEIADRVASDIGPVILLSMEEARMATRFVLPNEDPSRCERIATALYQAYREEEWHSPEYLASTEAREEEDQYR